MNTNAPVLRAPEGNETGGEHSFVSSEGFRERRFITRYMGLMQCTEPEARSVYMHATARFQVFSSTPHRHGI